jgi:hypothetical protein
MRFTPSSPPLLSPHRDPTDRLPAAYMQYKNVAAFKHIAMIVFARPFGYISAMGSMGPNGGL